MIIKTKFDIGDTVWYAADFSHKALRSTITSIQIYISKDKTSFARYGKADGSSGVEGTLYKTKEELEKEWTPG